MKGQKIHMVGIGGIGMSALAQLYFHAGARVVGSDRAESPVTDYLRGLGIEVFVGHEALHVASSLCGGASYTSGKASIALFTC